MYKGYLHARVLSNLCTLWLDHQRITHACLAAHLLTVLLTLAAAQLRSLMFDVLCRFPGTYAAYDNAITSAVDSKMLMEAAIYTSTEPTAANHHFNIHNGDTFCWSQVQLNKCQMPDKCEASLICRITAKGMEACHPSTYPCCPALPSIPSSAYLAQHTLPSMSCPACFSQHATLSLLRSSDNHS